MARLCFGIVLALVAATAGADEFNMRQGVTDISHSVYDLHMYIFWICVVIGIIVFGAMFWSLIHHRKSAGAVPAQFHESTRLEIAWTLVPTLILIAIAWPATQVLVAMYDTGGEDLTVEVRGYQWKWQYKYLDEDYNTTFGYFSNLATPQDEIHGKTAKGEWYLLDVDEPLRIPTNRKVRFLITAEDVIHSWWVPDFGIKRDAIPGILNDLWAIVPEPGIYRGQCTELCGQNHGFMPVVVQAMPEDEFDSWYADRLSQEEKRKEALSKTFTPEELMAQGEQVYTTYCSSCHMPNGQGVPPVFPALDGSAVATGPRNEHLNVVVNGRTGTAMQAFGKQLDAAQIAAVVHYERHSWSNKTDDVTQPRDVIEFMGQ